MAEACTVSHADSRRRLPSWMLKTCSSNEVSKTEDGNVQASEPDKQPGALDRIKPIKRKSGWCLKSVDKEDDCDRGTLPRCQGREKVARRKSKNADHAVEGEYEEIEKVTSKNIRKASGRAVSENCRKRKLKNIEAEASSPGSTDDEVELTVEDLVSIAEEIVNADKEKQQVQPIKAVEFPQYEEYPPCPPISTAVDTKGSVLNDRSMKGLLPCTTTIADTISTAVDTGGSESNARPTKGLLQCTTASTNTTTSGCGVEKNNRHDELQCSTSVKMTGDVAQDMLNIFLGPLWSKPPAYERKSDAIESIMMNVDHTSETRYLHSEAQRQGVTLTKTKSSLKDKLLETKNLHNKVQRQEATVTKKKSSLKDKVALFL